MKLTFPFGSLDARGTIGKALTASYWRGVHYLRARVIPNNPQSTCQTVIRKVITRATQGWKNNESGIDATQQAQWDSYAQGSAESGINRYLRAFVAENYSTPCTMQTPVVYPTPA